MGHCKRFLNEGRKEEKEGGKEEQEELSESKAYLPVGVFPVDGLAQGFSLSGVSTECSGCSVRSLRFGW